MRAEDLHFMAIVDRDFFLDGRQGYGSTRSANAGEKIPWYDSGGFQADFGKALAVIERRTEDPLLCDSPAAQ